jgi:hypothetical protein
MLLNELKLGDTCPNLISLKYFISKYNINDITPSTKIKGPAFIKIFEITLEGVFRILLNKIIRIIIIDKIKTE